MSNSGFTAFYYHRCSWWRRLLRLACPHDPVPIVGSQYAPGTGTGTGTDVEEGTYSNIREILGPFIGRTIVDITQHDREDFQRTGQSYVQLMFDNGSFLKFPIGDDGFWSNDGVFGDTSEETS